MLSVQACHIVGLSPGAPAVVPSCLQILLYIAYIFIPPIYSTWTGCDAHNIKVQGDKRWLKHQHLQTLKPETKGWFLQKGKSKTSPKGGLCYEDYCSDQWKARGPMQCNASSLGLFHGFTLCWLPFYEDYWIEKWKAWGAREVVNNHYWLTTTLHQIQLSSISMIIALLVRKLEYCKKCANAEHGLIWWLEALPTLTRLPPAAVGWWSDSRLMIVQKVWMKIGWKWKLSDWAGKDGPTQAA